MTVRVVTLNDRRYLVVVPVVRLFLDVDQVAAAMARSGRIRMAAVELRERGFDLMLRGQTYVAQVRERPGELASADYDDWLSWETGTAQRLLGDHGYERLVR